MREYLTTGQHVHNSDMGYGVVQKHNSRFAHVKQDSGKETKHNQSDGQNKESGFANPLRNSMTKEQIQKKNQPILDDAAKRHGYTHFGNDSNGEHIYVDSQRRHRATSDSANGILIHHRLNEKNMTTNSKSFLTESSFRKFLDNHHSAMDKKIGSKEYHEGMAKAYQFLATHHKELGQDSKEKAALNKSKNHEKLSKEIS